MVTITLSAAGAKKAASRLREFLAADGINLKQTNAYEALAQTLGYANWNTLQALLNATAMSEGAVSPAATAPADKQTALTDKDEEVVQRVRARLAQARAGEKGPTGMLSGDLEQSLHRALGLASERHHAHATLEHLLLSLTEDQDSVSVLQACQVDLEQLRKALTEFIDSKLDHLVTTASGDPKPTTDFQRVIQRAAVHVHSSGREEVTGANVLVALFSERESPSVGFLQRQGMNRLDAVNYISLGRIIFTPGSEASLSEEEELRRLEEEFRKRREEVRRKRRPPQTPTAGVPVEPRPKPSPPLKAEAKLKE